MWLKGIGDTHISCTMVDQIWCQPDWKWSAVNFPYFIVMLIYLKLGHFNPNIQNVAMSYTHNFGIKTA